MYQMNFTVRRANEKMLTDDDVQTVLGILRPKIAADPNAVLFRYGLRDGVFEASAHVGETLTEAQFKGFVDDLLPAVATGSVSVVDDRGNQLFSASIDGDGNVRGSTEPTPPPRATTWTIPRA